MRKHTLSVLAAAAVGLTASMASAADLPRKAPAYVPPPAPPPITWTGCYIGGNVGGVFTRQSRRISMLGQSVTTILALPVAVRLAAIINGPAVG